MDSSHPTLCIYFIGYIRNLIEALELIYSYYEKEKSK